MRRKCFFVGKFRILLSATAEHDGAKYRNNPTQPFRVVGVLQCVHLVHLFLGLKGATTIPVPEQIKLLFLSGGSGYSEEHNLVTPLIDIHEAYQLKQQGQLDFSTVDANLFVGI
jgi:hypothetical protein